MGGIEGVFVDIETDEKEMK